MAKLTPDKRDELLIRLDQKVMDSLPKIERHLEKINGHINAHSDSIVALQTEMLNLKAEPTISKKALIGYITGVVAIIVALWKAFFKNGG